MLKSPINLGSFFNGKSSLGKLEQNKWVTLDNCDIHSEIGMVMPQLSMVSESTTPNESCFNTISPTGNVYFASKESGKIWKRTTAGSYSLVRTNANGAHTGCRYFNGYIWYWTATKLGYMVVDTEASPTDSLATGTGFRGSCEANNTMLIANDRYVARVDATNAVALTELILPAQYKTTDLINIGDDVLIGTYVSTDVAYCKSFLWDTVSTSWTYEDEIFEIGVNCFMQLDNIVIAQCGTQGRFYYWTGSKMAYFNKISGITTSLGEQKAVTYNSRPLFANATKIYSINKEDTSLPFAICGEYTCTGTISSIAVQGQTLLASVGTGVDKKGTSYATVTIESPEVQYPISSVKIKYDVYPTGVTIYTSVNGAGYVQQTSIVDTLRKEISFDGGIVDGDTTQIKVVLTPVGGFQPKIKTIILQ